MLNLVFLRFILIAGLYILPYLSFAQIFKGKVIDDQKSVDLPYANIGVRGKSIGGISDVKGNFNIDLSGAGPNDSIIISYLGYESKSFMKSDITTNPYRIRLKPVAYQLSEAVAYGKRKIIIIGNKGHGTRYTGWGDYSSSKGRLRGLDIQSISVPLKLSRFAMRLHDNTFDSVRIRLHILPYNLSGTTVSDELIKENIFFICKKDQKWVYVDLKPYNIIISQPIIVAAEWVDSWKSSTNTSGESDVLTISLSNKDGNSYERKTPEEPISVTKKSYTPTMYFETFRVGPDN